MRERSSEGETIQERIERDKERERERKRKRERERERQVGTKLKK